VIFNSIPNFLKHISIGCEYSLITENVIETFLSILNCFESSKKEGKIIYIEIFHPPNFMYFLYDSCCLCDILFSAKLINSNESFVLSEWSMIENGIESESRMKPKDFDVISKLFVEVFHYFRISEEKFLYEMRSNESPFRLLSVFCPSLIPSPNLNSIFGFEKISFSGRKRMMRSFASLFLRKRKNARGCLEFCSEFLEISKSQFSVVNESLCRDSDSLIEMNVFSEIEVGGSESDLLLKDNEREENDVFVGSEIDGFGKELCEVRQLLRLSGGSSRFWLAKSDDCIEIDDSVEVIELNDFHNNSSLKKVVFSSGSHLRQIEGFQRCTSLWRIEIPSSVELIGMFGFNGCTSLTEVIFSRESHLREIRGFHRCRSLCRIELPSSIEVIGAFGFSDCTSLTEFIFASDSHWQEIDGFFKCTSLCPIKIPSSVQKIRGFGDCASLSVVTMSAGCRLTISNGFRNTRSFIVYEDENDVKEHRGRIHLGHGKRIKDAE
jgi:hypothetical protein